MKRPDVIKKIKNLLNQIEPTAEAIVYGSEARGDAGKDSDIDLLILLNQDTVTYKDIERIAYPLYDMEFTDNVVVSPLVYTKKEWESRPFATPFYLNVINEGIRL